MWYVPRNSQNLNPETENFAQQQVLLLFPFQNIKVKSIKLL